MKKMTLLVSTVLLTVAAFAQKPHEIQIRAGYGLAAYKTDVNFSYEANGIKLSTDTTDGAAAAAVPIEIRYQFMDRFNAGLDLKFGSYLYAPEDEAGKSNKFTIIGIGAEFLLVDAEGTRIYAGLGVNSGRLEMKEEKLDFFTGVYTETAKWSGPGYKLNLGICHYFADGPVALNFNLGYDSHNFNLDSVTRGGTDFDLTNFDGNLKLGGIEANIGLIVRLKV